MGQKGPRSPLEPNWVGSLISLGERMEKWPCEYLSGEEETAVAQALPSESGWPQGLSAPIWALLVMRGAYVAGRTAPYICAHASCFPDSLRCLQGR